MNQEQPELVVLFDGTCGVCTRTARWLRRRSPAGRVLVVPNQAPGVLERYGVTRAEADRAAWVITRDGRRLEGADAANRLFTELGGGWSAISSLFRVPPLRWIEGAFYRWFARNRSSFARFGVTPECDDPATHCA